MQHMPMDYRYPYRVDRRLAPIIVYHFGGKQLFYNNVGRLIDDDRFYNALIPGPSLSNVIMNAAQSFID